MCCRYITKQEYIYSCTKFMNFLFYRMTLGGIIPHLDGTTSPWEEGEVEEATDLQGGLVSVYNHVP